MKTLELDKLSKIELIHLIVSYDNYNNTHKAEKLDEGWHRWRPVCLEEFYLNEYSEIEPEENSCSKCGKIIPDGYDMCQSCEKERR